MTQTPYLFAAGKSVITADGTRATSLEFLGRKKPLEKLPEFPLTNPLPLVGADFEDVVADHFEWCDDCDSSKAAYWHEMETRENIADGSILEP